jgi:hypothetical protein
MGTSPKTLNKAIEERLARLPEHDLDPKISGKILSRAHELLLNREQRGQEFRPQNSLPWTLTLIYLTVQALFLFIDVIRIILYIYSP